MKFDALIKEKYGSVDKMLSDTKTTTVSRSYIYQMISGERTNISIDVALELVKILGLKNIDELVEVLRDTKEV